MAKPHLPKLRQWLLISWHFTGLLPVPRVDPSIGKTKARP